MLQCILYGEAKILPLTLELTLEYTFSSCKWPIIEKMGRIKDLVMPKRKSETNIKMRKKIRTVHWAIVRNTNCALAMLKGLANHLRVNLLQIFPLTFGTFIETCLSLSRLQHIKGMKSLSLMIESQKE